MDPNATLAEIREAATDYYGGKITAEEYASTVSLAFANLDEWIIKGGFRPNDWQRAPGQTGLVPRTLHYATVATADPQAEVVHAAIVRRVNRRIRYAAFTICDQRGLRVVTAGLHKPLSAVTCKQCRKQLIEDGVVEDG